MPAAEDDRKRPPPPTTNGGGGKRPAGLALLSFRSQGAGPGGDSLAVNFYGPDSFVLKAAAEDLTAALGDYPEVTGLQDSLPMGKEDMVLRLTPLGEALQVTGKGGKQRLVPILPICRDAVAEYQSQCPWPVAPDDALFRGVKGGPLSQGMVQKAMAKARRALGLPDTATPHALRHSFATHLLEGGTDIRVIQVLLFHNDPETTKIYTKVATKTIQDVTSPLDLLVRREAGAG